MRPDSIVYTSNTGFTRQYAILLGERTGLPVYSLEEAGKKLEQGKGIIYLGWLMAGKVQGYAKASARYRVVAVCGVGMGASGSQTEDVRKANTLGDEMPVFTLQGGFDMKKLRGIYRLMMTIMAKTVGKNLAQKEDRTPEESDMLDLLVHGGNRVDAESLREVMKWYREAE